MLNPKIQDAINEQINAEFYSAFLYLSMSMHFEAEGLSGIANWFKVQFQEEQAHAEIFMNYINQRGGRVELKAIEAVPTSWESPMAAFQATLEHEQKVTALINSLYSLATKEDNCRTLIDKLKLIGDNGMGLYMVSQELATRTYTTPSPLASAE